MYMSLWSRFRNVFRGDRLRAEIGEELESHLEEARDHGRKTDEVRHAFGSVLRQSEASYDTRVIGWLDSLRADALFGWRQLVKNRVTSAAAILSLGVGIGACTSAFRLIDALLLRPLPVAHAERLYDLSRDEIGFDGKPTTFDGWAYPAFLRMRAAVRDEADLIAVSYASRADLTYRSDEEMEKAYVQYVSPWMFSRFGVRSAAGRVFAEKDEAEAYAVLSHDYWARRFGDDPAVVGRTLRLGERLYEIIGVAQAPFTGTEPGTMTDIFLPAAMNPSATRADSTWHRTLAILKPGANAERVRQKLDVVSLAFERERARGFTDMSRQNIENYLNQTVRLAPAPSGVSDMQHENRRALAALAVLVALVLLIACANVANLMTAQATARGREMALRVSIGAGRARLVQLVLVEGAMLALLAAVVGALFAWWSAPLVVGMMNPPGDPVRLLLPADWRVLGFGLALTCGVVLLFGIGPAARASAVKPATTLKGGDDPHSRRRLMHSLIAVQVAFCFLVLFVTGLFVATFNRLAHQPVGFSAERLLTLDSFAQSGQPYARWDEAAERLRAAPGVEKVALAGWPLLSGVGWNDAISLNGGPPSDDLTYFLSVSPGWLETMRIPLLDGRDFRPEDTYPGVAIVNQTFVKRYFKGENPVGKEVEQAEDEGARFRLRIVGVVRDARYRGIREPIPPVAYVPFHTVKAIRGGTFIVRTATPDPLALAPMLRKAVTQAGLGLRVSNVRTQEEINRALTVRERLLAVLAMFFAGVALLLAGVGLYGVLDYSVLQRRREIGIRVAIGARPGRIARLVTVDVFAMVMAGALGGLVLGAVSVRYIATLFYDVRPSDAGVVAFPALALLGAVLLASLRPLIRAIRIDPVAALRAE
jgi:putative ABC transport system permease protein